MYRILKNHILKVVAGRKAAAIAAMNNRNTHYQMHLYWQFRYLENKMAERRGPDRTMLARQAALEGKLRWPASGRITMGRMTLLSLDRKVRKRMLACAKFDYVLEKDIEKGKDEEFEFFLFSDDEE